MNLFSKIVNSIRKKKPSPTVSLIPMNPILFSHLMRGNSLLSPKVDFRTPQRPVNIYSYGSHSPVTLNLYSYGRNEEQRSRSHEDERMVLGCPRKSGLIITDSDTGPSMSSHWSSSDNGSSSSYGYDSSSSCDSGSSSYSSCD